MTPTRSALERGDPRVADQAKRQGPFWDMIEGRAPAPPVAKLLGWKLVEIHPEQGRVRVEFEASVLGGDGFGQTLELKTSFLRPARVGKIYGEGRVVATATATTRVIPFAPRSDA
jgi:acyl-coenzyme A thioesterase PaaI-like protein